MSETVICPYCDKPAQRVNSSVVYGRNSDYGDIWLCRCLPDLAYVGVHKITGKPLGRLANRELRELKKKAHSLFDPMWKFGKMTRTEAYAWLAEKLELPLSECHIGMFDDALCRRVIELCAEAQPQSLELQGRDRLWCRAIFETLDTQAAEAILKKFNELKEKT